MDKPIFMSCLFECPQKNCHDGTTYDDNIEYCRRCNGSGYISRNVPWTAFVQIVREALDAATTD